MQIPTITKVPRDHWNLEPARKGRLNANQFDRLANIDLTASNDPEGELLKRIKSRFGFTLSDLHKLTAEQFRDLIEIATEEREQEFSALIAEIKGETLHQGSPYPDERWDNETPPFKFEQIPTPLELMGEGQNRAEAKAIVEQLWEEAWKNSCYREQVTDFPEPTPTNGRRRRPTNGPTSPRHRLTTATATEWPRPNFQIITD